MFMDDQTTYGYAVYLKDVSDNFRCDFKNKKAAMKYAETLLELYSEDPNVDVVIARRIILKERD